MVTEHPGSQLQESSLKARGVATNVLREQSFKICVRSIVLFIGNGLFMTKNFLRKTTVWLFVATMCTVSSGYAVETTIRPGLWETSTTSDLLKLVPSIPPDQMENLMNLAKQHGIDMPKIENGAASARICITPEMAKKKMVPGLYQSQAGCTVQNTSQSGSRYSIDYTCSNADVKGTGKAEGNFSSPQQFAGRTTFDGIVRGNPIVQQAESTGRWLSDTCGAVKPFQ